MDAPHVTTTSALTTPTPPGEGHGQATNASVGVTGLVLFAVVLIVVVLARRRCQKNPQDNKSMHSDDISDIFVQEDKFVRSTSQWIDLHENVKAVIKGVLVDHPLNDLSRSRYTRNVITLQHQEAIT